jgi:hypothetical protein
MRWLKLIVSGLFALIAVAAGLVVTTVIVTIGFTIAAVNRLSGRTPRPVRARWQAKAPRMIKRVSAAEVSVTDVPSAPRAITAAPVDSAP